MQVCMYKPLPSQLKKVSEHNSLCPSFSSLIQFTRTVAVVSTLWDYLLSITCARCTSYSLLEVLGIPEGGGNVKAQKRRQEISRGVLEVCKINKSKEKARIQHSIGHLRFPSAQQRTIDMKMIFYSDANKAHFHMNGSALSLVFKPRFLFNMLAITLSVIPTIN